MYNNIGGKIKILAKVFAWIGFSLGIICAIGVIISGLTSGNLGDFLLSLVFGLLMAGISGLAAWVGSFLLYGFGQLIENSDRLVATQHLLLTLTTRLFTPASSTPSSDSADAPPPDSPKGRLNALQSLRDKGIITPEEYEEKRQELYREIIEKRPPQQAEPGDEGDKA